MRIRESMDIIYIYIYLHTPAIGTPSNRGILDFMLAYTSDELRIDGKRSIGIFNSLKN